MAVAPVYVDAPAIAPAKYNLLDTIGLTGGDPHAGLGVQYEPEFCGPALAYEAPCETPAGPKVDSDGIETVVGEPIPVYHLFSCRLIGSNDRAEQRARTALELGASRAVAQGFQTVFGTGATDLTPGGPTPVHPVDALALLEEYAGENYGGTPVIHVSRGQATQLFASQVLFRVGDHLETGLGSIVVADAGYDPKAAFPAAPTATSGWMYATGAVSIWSAGEPVITPVTLTMPTDNTFRSLAERIYTPAFECFNAAVQAEDFAA